MDTACYRSESSSLVESYLHHCPAREVLAVLADKWVMLVLSVLRDNDGPIRFNDLRRRLDGITQKMLTRTLRNLEREGLVRRAVYPTVPPRVEYSLTELGSSIGALSHAMGVWAVEHQHEILAARAEFDARSAAEPEPLPVRPAR
ncbi:helix-turn-helix transcriptional regulator [Nocardia amamiensis]|uniref:Helix-turn-helix transcriptional regulator n=1 Tax=Nocardia amamiensis TaxID=404578 RepID=A0ABS0CLU6_9NOCA|nr:helix-turn-helix domain-containing protein [Nocardia amamiensis]MBF6297221.1 helix-turn-helix transcriptional regulator [Nocardia amamiensis]